MGPTLLPLSVGVGVGYIRVNVCCVDSTMPGSGHELLDEVGFSSAAPVTDICRFRNQPIRKLRFRNQNSRFSNYDSETKAVRFRNQMVRFRNQMVRFRNQASPDSETKTADSETKTAE